MLSEDLRLDVRSIKPLQFELSCITTGGPPTHVIWTDITRTVTLSDAQTSDIELVNSADSTFLLTATFSDVYARVGTYELRAWNVRTRGTPVLTTISIAGAVLLSEYYYVCVYL